MTLLPLLPHYSLKTKDSFPFSRMLRKETLGARERLNLPDEKETNGNGHIFRLNHLTIFAAKLGIFFLEANNTYASITLIGLHTFTNI